MSIIEAEMAVDICTFMVFSGVGHLLCVLIRLAVCPRVEGFATFLELSTPKMIIRTGFVERVSVKHLPALRALNLAGLYK